MKSKFTIQVYSVVRNIPLGKTMTYGEVAKSIGKPGAARAVGQVLKKNFDQSIPCHRVVRSDGKIGGYNRGIKRKKELLVSEGALRS